MGNIFKKIGKKIKKAGRFVDLTSSKSLGGLGKYTAVVARPAIATMKVGTGVTALEYVGGKALSAVGAKKAGSYLQRDVKRTLPEAVKGYAIGASAGLAIAGGAKITDLARNAIGDVVTTGGAPGTPAPVAPAAAAPAGEGPGFFALLLEIAFPRE